MANKYRLQRVDPSDGSQETNHFGGDQGNVTGSQMKQNTSQEPYSMERPHEVHMTTTDQRYPYTLGPYPYVAGPKRHIWLWVLLGVFAVIVLVGGAVWLTGISGSLAHLNQTATQNNHLLVHQSALLTGIRAQLKQMNQQLSSISQELTTFFANIMRAISAGRL